MVCLVAQCKDVLKGARLKSGTRQGYLITILIYIDTYKVMIYMPDNNTIKIKGRNPKPNRIKRHWSFPIMYNFLSLRYINFYL